MKIYLLLNGADSLPLTIWSVPWEKPTSIDPDQPKHAAQDYPDIHFSPPVDFLFQEWIIIIYLYPSETEWVGPDQFAQTAQADLGRYMTQRP